MTAVKLSDMMKKDSFCPLSCFLPKQTGEWQICQKPFSSCADINRNIFLLLTEPAVEMLELTVRYAGWSETLGLYRSLILQ